MTVPNAPARPTVRRRRLGATLRDHRTKAGLSLEQAAAKMGKPWDGPKISRIENGYSRITGAELEALLGRYGGVEAEVIARLVDLAKVSGQRDWWVNYGPVVAHPAIEDLIYAENQALTVCSYYGPVIPGLLQTAAYAYEINAGSNAIDRSKEFTSASVDLRMARRAVLTKPDAPQFRFIVNEGLLMMRFRRAGLMREQLQRLLDVSSLANVSLRVLPLDAPPCAATYGSFDVFRFPQPFMPMVLQEGITGMRFFEGEEVAERCDNGFQNISAISASAEDSREIIRKHMEGHAP